MKLTPQQLVQLQRKELELLTLFAGLCQALELPYYVLGGTLLGAVRHQGFIPWDDDVDVGMLRADYETFLTQAPRLLPEGIFLQTRRSDPGFPANYAKLRNENSAFVESASRHLPIHHGISLDVFPLDFYPDRGQLFFEAQNLLLKLRITDAFPSPSRKPHTRMLRQVSRLLYPSVEAALDAQERLFCSVSQGRRIANHCGAWGKREIVPAGWYGEGAALSFEGLTVTAPCCYDAWLRQVYGDYRTLPPEGKRHSHHDIAFFDPDGPYHPK